MDEVEVHVVLPKFKFDSSLNLNEVVQKVSDEFESLTSSIINWHLTAWNSRYFRDYCDIPASRSWWSFGRQVEGVEHYSEVGHCRRWEGNHCLVSDGDWAGQQVWWRPTRVCRRSSVLILHRRRHHRRETFQRPCQQPRILNRNFHFPSTTKQHWAALKHRRMEGLGKSFAFPG